MKCINKRVLAGLLVVCVFVSVTGCGKAKSVVENGYPVYGESSSVNVLSGAEDTVSSYFGANLCVGGTENIGQESVEHNSVAEAAGVFNTATNTITYAQNIYERMYPASTTKILTAYLAIKYGNLSDVVTISDNAVNLASDSSKCGLQAGDQMTLQDLLYGLMLRSGNDAAIAIAEHISGSVEAFVDLMNQKAQQLGATGSHFMNPNGLPDENHYTTAHDMALIFREAIKNQDFLDIIGTQSFTIDPTNMNPESRTYSTHHALVAQGAPEYYEGCFGGKTGVTEASKNTLVSGATRDGMTLIAVAMRADAGQVCQDHISMFDYGFNNFQKVEVPGGAVTIPKDVQVSDLTNTDNSYYYGTDYYVGSGSKEVQEEEPSEIAAEETTPTPEVAPESPDSNTGQEEKTQDMTVYRYVIYILAGLIAVTLVVTIVSGIRKHMKKKKRRRKS